MDASLLHASCQPSNRVSVSAEPSVVQLVLASVARAEQRAALVAAGGVPRARRERRGGRSQQAQLIRIDRVENVDAAPSRSRLQLPDAVPRSAGGTARRPNAINPTMPIAAAPSISAPAATASAIDAASAPCLAPPIAWPERVLQIVHMACMSEDTYEPLVLSFDNWAQREGLFSSSRPLAERL